MRLIILCFVLASMSCKSHDYDHPHVIIETRLGDIELELFEDKAPKTVSAFLSYIDAGLYKNATFYRVLNNENQPMDAFKSQLIQGGIWKTNYERAIAIPGIPHESTHQTGILHKDGTISLARSEPGTASTEFFICIKEQPGYDFGGGNSPDKLGYAAFGRVVNGYKVVKSIYHASEFNQALDPPVDIFNMKILSRK